MKVTSTSRNTASVEDIVLRENQVTRLIFRPLLLNNERDQRASLKGTFVFQRKGKSQQWEDHRILDLNRLKADEWIKLELSSREVLQLYQELGTLYALYDEEGIPRGEVEYVRAASGLAALLNTSDQQFGQLLHESDSSGQVLLERILNWFTSNPNPALVLDQLESLDAEQLSRLSSLAGLQALKAILQVWNDNQTSNDEEFWQKCLEESGFVLTQVFAFPVVILKGKAYVGGKIATNRGGRIVDFFLKNAITHNAALVEIKTPMTPLLHRQAYRDNTYSISNEVSGAIVQVLSYRQSLMTNYLSLRYGGNQVMTFEAFEPAAIVIAGNLARELRDRAKRSSFELFRSQLKHVQLITYDELFAKIAALVRLLESGDAASEEETSQEVDWDIPLEATFSQEEDIPF